MGNTDQNEGSNGYGNGHDGNGNGHGATVQWAAAPLEHRQDEDRGLELGHVWRILREGWRAIAVISFVVFAVIVGQTLRSPMEFQLKGSLYLGDLQSNGGLLDALSAQFDSGGEKGDIGTEIEILKSRELMNQAILASGLNARITPVGWTAPRYWRWRLDKRDLRSLEGGWGEVRAVSTRLTGSVERARILDVLFQSDTEYEIRDGNVQIGTGQLGKPLIAPGIEVTLIAGTDRSPKKGARYSLKIVPVAAALDGVAGSVSAKTPKASSGSSIKVVHLQLTTTAPYQGREFLEQLMVSYLEQNLSWKTEEAAAAEKFLTTQLDGVRRSLKKAGEDLAAYKKGATSIVLTEEAKSIIEQIAKVEEERVAARLQVAALEQVRKALAKGSVPTEAYLLGEAQDTVLLSMSESLAKSQLEYTRLSGQFTPDYPVVREAKAGLDAQLATVRKYVETRLSRAQAQVTALDEAVANYGEKLKGMPDAELKLAELTREADVYSRLYSFLLERQQQAGLTKASTISKSRILDTPLLPTQESSPRLRARAGMGLFLGLLLGVAFVLLRWRLATTFRSESEVRKAMPGVPLFASVPKQPHDDKAEGDRASLFEALAADLRSPFAEAFRLLRTNIYYSGSLEHDKVILMSSPSPADGKTMTTLCLAGLLAADGKKVLVVDGDMRKPSHHVILRQPQHPGLSGILTGEIHWSKAAHTVRSPFGEFSSISTGIVPPNPAELLSNSNLSSFLKEARNAFDIVLVDSPPFPLVSDGLVLSRHVDRLLSVIRVRNTHRSVATEHLRRLASVSQRYGIVINDVSEGSAYGYGNGYGYGYGYGVRYGYVSTPQSKKKAKKKSKAATDSNPDNVS